MRKAGVARWAFAITTTIVACSVPLAVAEEESSNAIERTVAIAKEGELWSKATTAAERLDAIREVYKTYDIVSDPVSDRYLITRYAGPIDVVHFLGLAVLVASGKQEWEASLYRQWKAEGGEDFEAGRTRTFPTEAHPDDLPSNALGALFGEEIRERNALAEEAFDVVEELRKFLAPLGIVEDEVAQRYSHRLVVMGLNENSTRKQDTARREWFTARPLFILPLVDRARSRSVRNANDALRVAGFRLIEIEGKEIGVVRIAEE